METATGSSTITERDKAIANLRARAGKARLRIRWVLGMLLFAILAVAVTDLSELGLNRISSQRRDMQLIRNVVSTVESYAHDRRPEVDLRNKFAALMDEQIGPLSKTGVEPKLAANPQFEEINQRLDKTLEEYAKAAEIETHNEMARRLPPSTDWTAFANSVITSIGAIMFAIFFIQIALNFMRYYAQLAELYDAQADALVAAAGDQDRAAKFLEQFSPTIEFGKTPVTIYEKSLDVVKEALGHAAKRQG